MSVDEALPLLEESLDVYREAGAETAREGIVDAACALGGLLRSQTKFAAVEQLADGLLLELGELDDAATARLLALRGSAVVAAWDDFDRGGVDGERALDLARRAGDPDAELEALQLVTSCTGDDRRERRALGRDRVARTCPGPLGSRHQFRAHPGGVPRHRRARAGAVRGRAGGQSSRRPAVSPTSSPGSTTSVPRHTSSPEAGTTRSRVGLRAIEAAEARALFRIAVRTWFALRPIAQARGRTDLIERAFPVFDGIRGSSQSPYARVIVAAMELAFAEAGLRPAFVPELEPRLASFDLGYGDPSWIAALEAVVESWLDAGAVADARTALDRLRASIEGKRLSQLALASQALMRSRLLLAEGDAAAAAAEAERALDTDAPWWRVAGAARARGGGGRLAGGARRGGRARAFARDRARPVDSAPWPGTS